MGDFPQAVTHGVPDHRLRRANRHGIRPGGDFVLYWMISTRRLADNFGLQYAAGEAERLGRPLVILEALRCDYPGASDRLHRFVLDGMAAHARALARSRVVYHPYVERETGAGRGLLETLGENACLVVTDAYPCFFLPRMVEAAARRIDVCMVTADSNGLLPLHVTETEFTSAYAFRRYLQRVLPEHLDAAPLASPLKRRKLERPVEMPAIVTDRWPAATIAEMESAALLAGLPIDHTVAAVSRIGGERPANTLLDIFLDQKLDRYAEDRNRPGVDGASGLSPYLHFGHISVHRVVRELAAREAWSVDDVSKRADGKKAGWWGMSPSAEAFLDQIVTWRELGFNMSSHRSDYASYDALPAWARATLADHEADARPWIHSFDAFESAATHDELWNAAQRELLREGRIHNYLRMLWGKKILEWTASPQEAADVMVRLNDRWAVDGRDPNSYSGIFWCLGRYDRPWPERPIYGTVRCMTSDSTRRKFDVKAYVRKWSE